MRPAPLPTLAAALSLTLSFSAAVPASAADPPASAEVDRAAVETAREEGVAFLRGSQNADGGWKAPEPLGITALAAVALMESGVPADDPAVAKAVEYVAAAAKPDGGIYEEGTVHRNYETALSLMLFSKIPGDRYAEEIEGGRAFLKELQWDEGEGIESSDTAYGGAGYGGSSRPDLSNTQFLLEALKQTGSGPDDPAVQKAMAFVARTQNLEGYGNDTKFADKIGDGGFYYTPAAGGQSKAGETANGGLRSYGSMTYAGLKSMIYAGLTPDDPRVQAARDWAAENYTVDENPGMGGQGYFYYLQTLGKTLNTLGGDTLTDASGEDRPWRADVSAKLVELQRSNGSWTNPADRWYEGDPTLVTSYALLALSDAAPPAGAEDDDAKEGK